MELFCILAVPPAYAHAVLVRTAWRRDEMRFRGKKALLTVVEQRGAAKCVAMKRTRHDTVSELASGENIQALPTSSSLPSCNKRAARSIQQQRNNGFQLANCSNGTPPLTATIAAHKSHSQRHCSPSHLPSPQLRRHFNVPILFISS